MPSRLRQTLLPGGATVVLVLALAGCATPGPTHAYLASRAEDPILDLLPGSPDAKVPTYLGAMNELYGIAYDPFTDHLFLRVLPGDFIRVIDRPAGKIKRSFFVESLPPGRGDLAIRSRDRHLFFADPARPAIIETTLFGRPVRTILLDGLQGPPAGVAYDQRRDRLLILAGGDLARVSAYDLSGKRLSGVSLDRNVRLVSLAYDSVASEFYVPLLDPPVVGVFDVQGRLVRTVGDPSGGAHDFVDVGPRSLLRLF
ncbi:MAG TPA: hypothetical protein VIO38_01995 [Rariglobus sp.]